MPTYTNNTTEPIKVTDCMWVMNGQTYVTDKVLNIPGLTLVSNAPYYNPIVSITTLTFASSGASASVDIDIANTQYIDIQKVTPATVTAYINAIANTPALAVLTATSPISDFMPRGGVSRLIFIATASGTLEVVQKKQRLTDKVPA